MTTILFLWTLKINFFQKKKNSPQFDININATDVNDLHLKNAKKYYKLFTKNWNIQKNDKAHTTWVKMIILAKCITQRACCAVSKIVEKMFHKIDLLLVDVAKIQSTLQLMRAKLYSSIHCNIKYYFLCYSSGV